MSKILFIVGSLRKDSFNAQLAAKAEAVLAGKAEVTYLDWSQIPFMNQDIEVPAPASVAAARQEVLNADAIWLFTPTYNFMLPGTIKNLFDWLSRALDLSDPTGPSALQDKVIAVSSVANGTSPEALFTQARQLFPFIRMNLVEKQVGVSINPEAWGTGILDVSEESLSELQAQAQALLEATN